MESLDKEKEEIEKQREKNTLESKAREALSLVYRDGLGFVPREEALQYGIDHKLFTQEDIDRAANHYARFHPSPLSYGTNP